MLATIHWTWGDNTEGCVVCNTYDAVEHEIGVSRECLLFGSEIGFWIEWH